MEKKQIVLSAEARGELERFSTKGVHSVRLVNRAKIILALDTGEGRKPRMQKDIAERGGVSRQTLNTARDDFLEAESVPAFLQRKKRQTPPIEPKITGQVQAHIIALACTEAPQGYARWTLQLLADKSVELQYIDSISAMSISRVLKKTNLNPT
jgi:hypothetical protein